MDDVQKTLRDDKVWLDRGQGAGEHGQGEPSALARQPAAPIGNPLREIADFGDNPGNLRLLISAPALSTGVATSLRAHAGAGTRPGHPPRSPALVVALHGCTQTPQAYNHGSGWSDLANRHGFALVMPGQRPANNANRCFNWFSPDHTARDAGEARSIRQMIAYMIANHGVDPDRIYVTGLSAGGAMAACLLAVYPDVFAGGAILSGLPFGAAASLPEALGSMAQSRRQSPATWGAIVRAATAYEGPWPRVSVWHGSADSVVHPSNAEALASQWGNLHGLTAPADEERIAGHRRRFWRGSDGREVLELYEIAGMGHGVALANTGNDTCGAVGAFHLEADICSTRRIVRFWGLSNDGLGAVEAVAASDTPTARVPARAASTAYGATPGPAALTGISDDIRERITAALRQAGLLDSDHYTSPADPRQIVSATLRSLGLLKP